jgi:hypothetical protein
VKKSLFSSLEFTPQTLLSSHPERAFLPHSKKPTKRAKRKHNTTQKRQISQKEKEFSRLTD